MLGDGHVSTRLRTYEGFARRGEVLGDGDGSAERQNLGKVRDVVVK